MDIKDTNTQLELLRAYFKTNGLLLCNESKDLPYLELVGGDWNSIVALIESGEVFYSKLYKGRVTYLSKDFYANVKSHKQRLDKVSQTARKIYNFLSESGKATTADIKSMLMLSSKAFTKSMDELYRELLVTAAQRDRTINVNWSSFYWDTYKTWETLHPITNVKASEDNIKSLTKNLFNEKSLQSLLR